MNITEKVKNAGLEKEMRRYLSRVNPDYTQTNGKLNQAIEGMGTDRQHRIVENSTQLEKTVYNGHNATTVTDKGLQKQREDEYAADPITEDEYLTAKYDQETVEEIEELAAELVK